MTSSGRSWSWTLLLVVVFTLGMLFPGGSTAIGGVRGVGGANGGGGGIGDDETIGTLPILGNQGQLHFVRALHDMRPDFYLEGDYGDLLSTIVGFSGSGQVTLENLPSGSVRLGFHGQLDLTLDRGLLQVTGIQIGTSVPTAFRGARASSGLAGQTQSMPTLGAGNLVLPVAALDAAGSLTQYPWIFTAHSRFQGVYLFHALTEGAVLHIGQSYY